MATRFPLGRGKDENAAERSRQIHRLFHLDDAGLPAHGVKDPGIRGQRAGMAGRRLVSGLCLPAFQQNDGFFLADLPGAFKKPPAVFHAFNIEHDGIGQWVHLKGIQIILDGDHGFIAGAAKPADPDALLFGKSQKLGAHISGLGHHAGGAAFRPHVASRTVEINMRVADSHGVGADNIDAVGSGQVNQLFFLLAPSLPVSAKPDAIRSILVIPLALNCGIRSDTASAGMVTTATSTRPGMSATDLYTGRPAMVPPLGLTR